MNEITIDGKKFKQVKYILMGIKVVIDDTDYIEVEKLDVLFEDDKSYYFGTVEEDELKLYPMGKNEIINTKEEMEKAILEKKSFYLYFHDVGLAIECENMVKELKRKRFEKLIEHNEKLINTYQEENVVLNNKIYNLMEG